jgi:hypothetical protein
MKTGLIVILVFAVNAFLIYKFGCPPWVWCPWQCS